MKLPSLFPLSIMAVIAPLLTEPARADVMDACRGENRVIVVYLPPGPSAGQVSAMLVTRREAIEERDLKIIDVSEGAREIPTALRPPPDQARLLRKQLKLAAGEMRPVFILIGKDGG